MPQITKDDFPTREADCQHRPKHLVRMVTEKNRWIGCTRCGRKWEYDDAKWKFYRETLEIPVRERLVPSDLDYAEFIRQTTEDNREATR